MTKRAIGAAAAWCLTLAPAAALAQSKMTLNQVWSRLADVYGEYGSVESAEFSPDGQYIVSGTKFDNSVRIFRTSDGHQTLVRYVPQEIERVAWTRDGRYVISVSEDGLLRVFDVESGNVEYQHQHDNGIDGLTVSHGGRWMVSGQERVERIGKIRIFAVDGWKLTRTIDFPGTVNELDFSSDDRLLAAVGDYTARIYATENWRILHEFTLPRGEGMLDESNIYINTRFSPDNDLLAVGGQNGFVYIYNVASGDLVRRIHKDTEKTETVEWTKDGRYLLVAGNGMTIDFYAVEDILDPELNNDNLPFALRQPMTDALEYMHFDETGALLTTAHQDGTVKLWTFMSDDPLINQRRHREVRAEQDAANRAAGRKTD